MSVDIVQENVPPFVRRLGDGVLHGSNNAIVICGTDRAKAGPAKTADGLGHINAQGKGVGTGTVHIIAGRQDPNGDPDLVKDSSYLYLSMKTMADTNLSLTSVEKAANNKPSAILKSDVVRLVFRDSLKISDDGASNFVFVDKKYLVANVNGFIVKIDSNGVTVKADKGQVEVQPGKITVTIGNTSINLDPDNAIIHSPTIKLGGGGEKPWVDLMNSLVSDLKSHTHDVATAGSAAAQTGTASPSSNVKSSTSSWQSNATG